MVSWKIQSPLLTPSAWSLHRSTSFSLKASLATCTQPDTRHHQSALLAYCLGYLACGEIAAMPKGYEDTSKCLQVTLASREVFNLRHQNPTARHRLVPRRDKHLTVPAPVWRVSIRARGVGEAGRQASSVSAHTLPTALFPLRSGYPSAR
jgi:hypothetical protein